ncbi:transposase [Paenibacillus sp. FSL P2-0136]|uniref:transposase n=1 Tax=Paenibacillus sp. FSL P2-0136 TaxID=2975317 RepID=UPI0030DC95A2
MTIVPENLMNNLFGNLVTEFVKNNLESIMRAEIQQFMKNEQAGEHNSHNGYYTRSLHTTKYGHLEDLEVPRDRRGHF